MYNYRIEKNLGVTWRWIRRGWGRQSRPRGVAAARAGLGPAPADRSPAATAAAAAVGGGGDDDVGFAVRRDLRRETAAAAGTPSLTMMRTRTRTVAAVGGWCPASAATIRVQAQAPPEPGHAQGDAYRDTRASGKEGRGRDTSTERTRRIECVGARARLPGAERPA